MQRYYCERFFVIFIFFFCHTLFRRYTRRRFITLYSIMLYGRLFIEIRYTCAYKCRAARNWVVAIRTRDICVRAFTPFCCNVSNVCQLIVCVVTSVIGENTPAVPKKIIILRCSEIIKYSRIRDNSGVSRSFFWGGLRVGWSVIYIYYITQKTTLNNYKISDDVIDLRYTV